MSAPLTVYYDASCPLCATEMAAIKDHDRADRLMLIDCSHADFEGAVSASGPVTREAMLKRLHVRAEGGRWLVGVDAYEAIFSATGFARLAALVGNRRVRPLAERSYAWIARNRHRLPRRGLASLMRLAFGRARAS